MKNYRQIILLTFSLAVVFCAGQAVARRINTVGELTVTKSLVGDAIIKIKTKDGTSDAVLRFDTTDQDWALRLGSNDKLVIRNITAATTSLSFKTDGKINITDLAGSYTGGQASVCVNDNGDLAAVDGACS